MSTLNVNNINEAGGVDAVITSGILDSGSLPAGSIVAVKDVLKTDTFSASVSAGASVAVTGLSVTHEVANASNKLIISAFFGAASNSNGFSQLGLAVHDGTSLIGIGDSAGSRTSVSAGGQAQHSGGTIGVTMPAVTFVHTPGAGSKTYTIHALNVLTTTETLYINRSESDGVDNASRPRAVSALVIQEVAG